MKYLLIVLCLFVFSCDSDDDTNIDNPVIGTWKRDFTAEGYYYIDGENQNCQPISYSNNGYGIDEDEIFTATGFFHIQITENTYGVHWYLELPDTPENQCDNNILMTGIPELSFTNGICTSELLITIDSNFILEDDRFIFSDPEPNDADGDETEFYFYNLSNDNLVVWRTDLCAYLEDPISNMTGWDNCNNCFFNTYVDYDVNDDTECISNGGIWAPNCDKEYYYRINDSEF